MTLANFRGVTGPTHSSEWLRRRLIFQSALPIAVMAVWVTVLLWQVAQLVDTAQWVEHTEQVLAQVRTIESDIYEQIADVRAFLVTGAPRLLATYRDDTRARRGFAELRELTSDNPPQVERISRVEQQYQGWRRAADLEIEAVGGVGRSGVSAILLSQGVPADRAMRAGLDEIRSIEERLRIERTDRQARVRRQVIAVTSATAVLCAVVFSAVAWRQLTWVAASYASTQRALVDEAAALRHARAELQVHADTLEQQVRARTSELQRANHQLEAFASSVSHDLRAPLRGLQGLSQALLEDSGDELDARSRDFLRQIVAEAAAMDQLIQDLLEYSRLSRADLAVAAVPLGEVISAALHAVRAQIERDHAKVEVDGPMPVVRGNRAVLVQVFTNLLSNALKFSTAAPRVCVKAEEHGSDVRVWVEDKGIGVPPQYRERIFRVFERLHGTESYPGTGIGLAIVREGVERLGGHVGVESNRGGGSRFWIELPRAEAA